MKQSLVRPRNKHLALRVRCHYVVVILGEAGMRVHPRDHSFFSGAGRTLIPIG